MTMTQILHLATQASQAADAVRPAATTAPRGLTAAELQQAGGGRGLIIVCIEHKGQDICRMI